MAGECSHKKPKGHKLCHSCDGHKRAEAAEAKSARYREALSDIAEGNDNFCTDCQYNER